MANDDKFGKKDWLRLLASVAWFLVFVKWPQWTFAVTLLIIGCGFIAANAMIFWATVVHDGKAPAVAPIFGGIIAGIGVAILPLAGSWKWAWIPLLLDWGGLPMFLYYGIARRSKS